MTLTDEPVGLSARGKALWADISKERDLDGPTAVLVAEACRIADRLERLNGILRGKGREWITLAEQVQGDDPKIVVDAALSESRQQQLVLRQILAGLGVGAIEARKSGKANIIDVIAAKRAEREAKASG